MEGCQRGNVYGSYLHGIFDGEQAVQKLLEGLCKVKGISIGDIKPISQQEYRENQYDLLAQGVRENVEMDKIYEILERGI